MSLLTGYTLATAIIGGPVFVNRVLNAGADRSAAALTALTLAIAIGAVVGGVGSGLIGQRLVAVAGVALTAVGLWLAAGWGVDTDLARLQRDLAIFGAGFGLTVSPRATAAVEAAGASAYGVASAMLQVTRTIGMSVGLALLTSIGQNRIDELTALINDPPRRDALVSSLGHPEFVGVDPRVQPGAGGPARGLVARRGGRRAAPRLPDRPGGGGADRDPRAAGGGSPPGGLEERLRDDDQLAPVAVEALARLERQPFVVGRDRPARPRAAGRRVLQGERRVAVIGSARSSGQATLGWISVTR